MTTEADLAARYRDYLDCLNARAWPELGRHVAEDVVHNDRSLGLSGYRSMLERDTRDIPDLHFHPGLLAVQPPYVAVRLEFDCTPRGESLGLAVDGRRVRFTENVFYRYRDGLIDRVWSVIDKVALEQQLPAP